MLSLSAACVERGVPVPWTYGKHGGEGIARLLHLLLFAMGLGDMPKSIVNKEAETVSNAAAVTGGKTTNNNNNNDPKSRLKRSASTMTTSTGGGGGGGGGEGDGMTGNNGGGMDGRSRANEENVKNCLNGCLLVHRMKLIRFKAKVSTIQCSTIQYNTVQKKDI